jgi:enoyl-CoA hydratase/carnithine racemase
MLNAIMNECRLADADPSVDVIILTGTDPYYCAGVDLNGLFKPMAPSKLSSLFRERNQELFDAFLNRKKPLIVAVNGPAIGASVTSATLCDAIIASENASFLTPFEKLGVPPEGCSSVHFPRLIGTEVSRKMLEENWKVSAAEAKAINLVDEVVPHEKLVEAAQAMAEKWVAEGREAVTARGYKDFENLRAVNKQESMTLSKAFLSTRFLNKQYEFLSSKGKTIPALVFKLAAVSRPLWSMFVKL